MKTLSITLSDHLYDRLKHNIPPRRISKFVSEALEMKLDEKQHELYKAYLEAAMDHDREAEAKEWDVVNIEAWDSDPNERN